MTYDEIMKNVILFILIICYNFDCVVEQEIYAMTMLHTNTMLTIHQSEYLRVVQR